MQGGHPDDGLLDVCTGRRPSRVAVEAEQREVERYHGEGRVAARGFQHAHYVPGQLILVEPDTIGFLWQQMGIFVVFNREQDGPGEMMIEQRAVDA